MAAAQTVRVLILGTGNMASGHAKPFASDPAR